MKTFQPMLAPNDKVDLSSIGYPLLASYKLDGIRCIFKDGQMLSRSLKPIRNVQLQKRFAHLIKKSSSGIILDGELYSHDLTFQQITHFVMSEDTGDELPESIKFHCFDFLIDDNRSVEFQFRVNQYAKMLKDDKKCVCVGQTLVRNKIEVEDMFEDALKAGYEGLILKNPNGEYKFGRGTINEGLIFKVKPFQTYDLPIMDVFERMENTSESHTNELGHSQKSHCIADMKPTGIAAGFVTEYNGMPMKVTLTGDEAFRRGIWQNRKKYIGKIMEARAMSLGSKDVLRHPTFVRFREDK